jgi:signal transduction histidine kinase
VLEVVDRFQGQVDQPVSVRFLGPVDLMSDANLTDDVVAVVSEGVSNAVRHASASRVGVAIAAADGSVTVEIDDNGTGLPSDANFRGLANLRARADARGGTLEIVSDASDGTRLRWRVPAS